MFFSKLIAPMKFAGFGGTGGKDGFGFGDKSFGHCADKDDTDHTDTDTDTTTDTTTDPQLPELDSDTQWITFHVDYTGDGKADTWYDYSPTDLEGDAGTQTFTDYLAALKEDLAEDYPGVDPATLAFKATIHGPDGEETYYHFTGGEFDAVEEEEEEDESCGDKDDHGGKDWGGKQDDCGDRDDDTKGWGDKSWGGKDHGGKDAGGKEACFTGKGGDFWQAAGTWFEDLSTHLTPVDEDDSASDEDEDEDQDEEAFC